MAKYQVTRTETVTVFASNTEWAEESAIDEMQKHPNGDYEIVDITPNPNLEAIVSALAVYGVSAYVDDYKNNIADFIRLSAVESHPDDDDNHFILFGSLNDLEEFDGREYRLDHNGTGDTHAVFDGGLTPTVLASRIAVKLAEIREAEEVDMVRPVEMFASLEEIADMLTRMGYTASVESQAWRGMPAWLTIGETESTLIDGTPYTAPRFTLYYNLNETGSEISGSGYHLSAGDDEADIVAEIGNHTAPRIVGEILYNMGRADFDMEARR